MNKKRIIIDCDTGVDDAMAIIFALKSRMLVVDSITTVHGNVSLDQTTVNTLKILEFMSRIDIPVIMGSDKPKTLELINSKYVFGDDGLGNVSSTLPCSFNPIGNDAATHIINKIKRGGIDAIVAIGPLTNIANAYKLNKNTMNSLNEIIIMGGAIDVKGNITEYSEFNFYCDPYSADYVLKNSTNSTLVPLNVTNKVQFYKDDCNKIISLKEKKLFQDITKIWYAFSKEIGQDGIGLHDPLTVGYAINSEFLTSKPINLKICLNGDRAGHCETFSEKINNASTILYCNNLTDLDFKSYFINTLNEN
ncbi:hypothetical protein BJL95_16940 [Methylomonas sp. LWB]|uniref:nucleoside hydrolase n=1 Tax=Methylomonas sp. LWB TaxID=1905845 RepID=UPI0008DA4829|nr:nucleoside hydrolase [Methylomonas sp. LWB]OHX34360.1 hypothetical protein BJL95_16940 [Methylomonas sp. LWB]